MKFLNTVFFNKIGKDKTKFSEEKLKFNLFKEYNNKKIDEFCNKYDLKSIEGIKSIPVSEAQRYPNGGESVIYMPEQILNRKATEYKKSGKYDLAIECLKKSNELYPKSWYTYQRLDYERLVDIMILAGKYNEARKEHEHLDKTYGTRLSELKKLQQSVVNSNVESYDSYQKRIINPYIEESKDRELYYWLLENLNELAPKSFGCFRRMKNGNTESYQKIVLAINDMKIDINDIKFWI